MNTLLRSSLLAVALTASSLALAQTGPASGTPPSVRHHRAFQRVKMSVIAERIGLTDAQKTQWRALRQQTAEAAGKIRSNGALTGDQKHAQIAALWKSSQAQWRASLSADQQAKLAEVRSHPRTLNAMATRRMRLAVMARRLELTPAQRTQIRDIRQTARASLQPIRSDASLSPEQKRTKVREIAQASRDKIRGVLTPEQQRKLAKMRAHLLSRLGPLG